jgi:arsenite methyltransferase
VPRSIRDSLRGFTFGLVPLAVVLSTGCAPLSKVDLGRLVVSGRDGFQHPERVIESLELQPGDRVAEIGAGDGYWLPWLSQAVGSEGLVYAVEVEDEKVAALRERVAGEGLANVVVVRGRFEDPELPDGEIDLAMTCLTYHHIEERAAYFRRLQADLTQRGRVAHLDDRHDVRPPIRWLQSSGHWIDPEAVRTEMNEAGYRHVASFDFLPVQSFQIFEPARPDVQDARR